MFVDYNQAGQYPLDYLSFDEFVGAMISARRVDAGISRDALAEVLDVTSRQMREIEAGSYRPSASLMVAILKRFDLSLTDFIREYADLFSGARNTQVYDNVIFVAK